MSENQEPVTEETEGPEVVAHSVLDLQGAEADIEGSPNTICTDASSISYNC